jgi:hypothetical protein
VRHFASSVNCSIPTTLRFHPMGSRFACIIVQFDLFRQEIAQK